MTLLKLQTQLCSNYRARAFAAHMLNIEMHWLNTKWLDTDLLNLLDTDLCLSYQHYLELA